MIITIDGPTASGKSTVAKLLARRLGWYYLNTGLLYRALAYLLVKEFHYTSEQLSNPALHDIEYCLSIVRYTYDNEHSACIWAHDDINITYCLKTSDIDRKASIVSANHLVRLSLLSYQRALADHHHIVVDGRDTGSVVFPHAEYKFFLTASSSVRAQRWRSEQALQGKQFSEQESITIIHERDVRDSTRAHAPLVVPMGACVVDNSVMTVEKTVDTIASFIRNV